MAEHTSFSRPRRVSAKMSNPEETYARYERAPFRQYSEQRIEHNNGPLYGGGNGPQLSRTKTSRSSLLHRLLSRQDALEHTIKDSLGPTEPRQGKGRGLKRGPPNYSLAGPRPMESDRRNSYVDPDYEYAERSEGPVWGLAKPLPRVKRGKKNKKRNDNKPQRNVSHKSNASHPVGQVGGGPAGHHGDPAVGDPVGETAGGPATEPRGQSQAFDQDHFFEHFTDGLVNPLEEEPEDEDKNDEGEEIPNRWFELRKTFREPLAEWLATMIVILMGTCGNLQVKTSNGTAGNFTQEALTWGMGIMMSVYIAGGISGAHCNPSISIVLTIFRGFPGRKCLMYIMAQILGAMTAIAIAWALYKDAIMNFDPALSSGSKGSGTAFFTLPASFVSQIDAFFNDFASAAIQTGTILALGDDSNAPPGAGMHALILGLVAFTMASTFGYSTGPQTNPAKDFASRFVPWLVGYGTTPWEKGWWAEAWSASLLGSITGALIYDLAIFEGSESPINYPRHQRKKAAKKHKGRWFRFTARKGKANDLEDGNEKIQEESPALSRG